MFCCLVREAAATGVDFFQTSSCRAEHVFLLCDRPADDDPVGVCECLRDGRCSLHVLAVALDLGPGGPDVRGVDRELVRDPGPASVDLGCVLARADDPAQATLAGHGEEVVDGDVDLPPEHDLAVVLRHVREDGDADEFDVPRKLRHQVSERACSAVTLDRDQQLRHLDLRQEIDVALVGVLGVGEFEIRPRHQPLLGDLLEQAVADRAQDRVDLECHAGSSQRLRQTYHLVSDPPAPAPVSGLEVSRHRESFCGAHVYDAHAKILLFPRVEFTQNQRNPYRRLNMPYQDTFFFTLQQRERECKRSLGMRQSPRSY